MTATDPRELSPVAEALDELERTHAVRRLHERDPSLFSDDPDVQDKVADRLGWLDVAGPQPGWSQQLRAFADDVSAAGIDRVVLAGMGGSSLAPEVFATVFDGTRGATVEVLDSTHPVSVDAAFSGDLSRTLVVVASKSGGTEETRCFAARAGALVPDPTHLVAITDPGSALDNEARTAMWREVFTNPADIGGRFSALSLFGMLPAALAGVPLDAVWGRAGEMAERCAPTVPLRDNPAAVLGAYMGGLARAGRDKLTLVIDPSIAVLGDWIEQLVAESTGKQGQGVVPVVGEPVGSPDVYGDDRAFVAIGLDGGVVPGQDGLAEAGLPLLRLDLADRTDLGGAVLLWELATAYAGVILGVNPFDEPNVTESKRNTVDVLAEHERTGALPQPETGDLAGLLAALGDGDYLSIQAYLPMTPRNVADLERARLVVRNRRRVATTVGFGPRFLHSTGQLHKGGPDSAVCLQVVDAPQGGPDIPGRPYDFAALIQAQAAGDLRSLLAHDRRVVRVVLGDGGLEHLVEQLERLTP
jgi:transaldolase/glucose-6-phosphate isomerase